MKNKMRELPEMALPELHIRTRVRNSIGKIVSDKFQIGHSWTYNAWVAAFAMFTDAGLWTDGGVLGGLRVQNATAYSFSTQPLYSFYRGNITLSGAGFHNDAANDSFGIIVGTSDEPFHILDHKLWGKIANGAGPEELNYLSQPPPVTSFADNKYTITYQRTFTNTSGADVTVKEMGIVFLGYGNFSYNLFTRDVLDAADIIPNGAQYIVEVQMTSVSFADVGATWKRAEDIPIGTPGSGGFFIGGTREYSANNFNTHQKTGYILSPKIGGESSALAWRTDDNVIPDNALDGYNGYENMAAIYALGSDSPIGAFCSAANAALLGGYNDWYLPARYEVQQFFNAIAGELPIGNSLENANYWTTGSYYSTNQAYFVNPISAAASRTSFSGTYPVRLMRKINVQTEWIPDV